MLDGQSMTIRSDARGAKFCSENRLRTISKLIERAHGTDDELRMWIERTAAEIVPKLLGNGRLGGKMGTKTLHSMRPVVMHIPSTNLG